jgi:hypothetical protein
MTRTEQSVNRINKELDKLNAQLERAEKSYDKKLAMAEKLGVADWGIDEHNKWLETVPTTEFGYIIDNNDVKMNGAWFDLYSAKNTIEDIKGQLERKYKLLAKYQGERDAEIATEQEAEDVNNKAQIADTFLAVKLTQEEWEAYKQRLREEWGRDGIELTDIRGNSLEGKTPSGKRFYLYLNSGITDRSWHCYTLRIDGYQIFTSGTMASCYREIKRS